MEYGECECDTGQHKLTKIRWWATQVRRRDASSRKVVVEECRYDTADEAEPSDLAASSSLRTATSAPEASAHSTVHSRLSVGQVRLKAHIFSGIRVCRRRWANNLANNLASS